ncbi:MAG TPA: hypothetical protein PLZ36_03740 [Armatimonadota bacterium]|nr:hypothetical protein [Armatimonadota bacterium]
MAVDLARDPEALAAATAAFLDAAPPAGPGGEAEAMLRRAVTPLLADLFALDAKLRENADLSIAAFFGAALVEKMAGMLFLARFCLRFIAVSSGQSLDLTEMRRLLTLAIQALYQVQAVEGLMFLYDDAAGGRAGRHAEFWDGACLHLLSMLALLAEGRLRVLTFLHERPHARRHVEQMMALPDAQRAPAARELGQDYLDARRGQRPMEPLTTPPYLTMLMQFDPAPPDDAAAAFVALLAARERIRVAAESGDAAMLARWIAEGSAPAAQAALRAGKAHLAPGHYVDALARVIRHPHAPPLRLACAVQELGRLNHAANPNGGDPNLIPLLREMAMTDVPDRAGAARLAARAVAAVDAFNESLYLIENAVMVEVGEEAILHLRDTRRLALAEHAVKARPFLQMAYEDAFAHVQRAKSLMESVWSAQSEELAMLYLARLKELKAYPELQQLCQKRTKISDLAQKTLAELKLSMSAYREE